LHQSDSEQTIQRLFDEYFHQLVLSAFRYLKDYDLAEDVVQDIFVKLWQNFDQVSRVDDMKGYLFKAVQNSSINFLRHVKVRQKYILDSGVPGVSFEKSPEENITDRETSNRVNLAVNKLPENWREAFIYSKYDKLKYHEIAGKMNISQKTVEKYISRALHFLRKELIDLIMTIIIIWNFFINN
jgi:RNA polymerase sigma-70 factor (ECF subfamily)